MPFKNFLSSNSVMSLYKLMKEFCTFLDLGIADKCLNCVYCDFNKRNVTSHCAGSMFTTIYCYAVCCYFSWNYTGMCDKKLLV